MNQAITTLESPFARSDYNHRTLEKLKKHTIDFAKKKRNAALGAKLQNRAVPGKAAKSKTEAASTAKNSSTGKQTQMPTGKTSDENESKESKAKGAEHSKTESKAGEKSQLKFYEVAGLQVRPFKQWISVRINSSSMRRFLFKEWQDEKVATKVATAFAKKASSTLHTMKTAKVKKNKLAYMNELGIECMNGHETATELEDLLGQASYREPKPNSTSLGGHQVVNTHT